MVKVVSPSAGVLQKSLFGAGVLVLVRRRWFKMESRSDGLEQSLSRELLMGLMLIEVRRPLLQVVCEQSGSNGLAGSSPHRRISAPLLPS